jgi:hypothetical protein
VRHCNVHFERNYSSDVHASVWECTEIVDRDVKLALSLLYGQRGNHFTSQLVVYSKAVFSCLSCLEESPPVKTSACQKKSIAGEAAQLLLIIFKEMYL